MRILKRARTAARKLLGPRLTALVRRPFRQKLGAIADYRSHLDSKRGLEIGGPSSILAATGPIPVYDVLGSVDNCLYSSDTIWTGQVGTGNTFVYHPGKPPGTQLIGDATDLRGISQSSYDCVLASHCLEHVANPLRALAEWKRVLKNHGLLLLILPHKDGTFDWRRPTTRLSHMMEDFENGVSEGDLTHLAEIVDLHDLSKDEAAGTQEQFHQRCLANHVNRAMHHHVFDTRTALELIDHAGFHVIRIDTLKPYHIIILASVRDGPVDNRRALSADAAHWNLSPFPSDHKPAAN